MRRATLLAAMAIAGTVAVSACSSAATPSAASSPALHAGAGQSLAGAPGTGTASPLSGGTSMPGMSMSPSSTSSLPVGPVGGNAVTIHNFAFAPASLIVKVGTTVTWTNQDTDDHTVTSQNSSGPLGSSPLGTGQSFSFKFTKAGTYNYFCTIHPFMTATVTVMQ